MPQPFRKAMASKYPHQQLFFASWQRPRDIRSLNEILVSMSPLYHSVNWSVYSPYSSSFFCVVLLDVAKDYPHAMELNVLVIGMPNVGKSTLLNALRNMGIKGRM